MPGGRHLVARQTVELVAADRFAAEALMARTSAAAGRLAAAVEGALDALDEPGLRLRIDRIELDLGVCDPARWEDALADGIRANLGERVAAAFPRDGASASDPATAALLLLATFARTGRLPWWSAAADTPASAVATLSERGIPPVEVRAILAQPEAVERLVRQLGETSLLTLLRLARPDLPADVTFAELAPDEASVGPATARAGERWARSATWAAVLAEGAMIPRAALANTRASAQAPGSTADTKLFRRKVALRLGIDPAEAASAPMHDRRQTDREARPRAASELNPVGPADPVDHAGPSATAPAPHASSLAARLASIAQHQPAVPAGHLTRLSALASRLDEAAAEAALALLDQATVVPPWPALLEIFVAEGVVSAAAASAVRAALAHVAMVEDDAHDALTIATAGLPLLWPFLPRFFEALDLLEGERFRDPMGPHRAAALLHYLATGDPDAPEQALPLPKLLAGLDLDAVHLPGEPLNQPEISAAEALLEAVLGHAPMLGRIGVAGLRQAYLTRPGLLATRDGHWLLRVERRSFDLLLDRLPWSFGWVRLPWMAAPMQVEW